MVAHISNFIRRTRRTIGRGSAGLLLVAASTLGCASVGDHVDPNLYVEPPVQLPPALPGELPPPVSGGTLLITRNDATAVAADPDRDAVWVVDLGKRSVRSRVQLAKGTEPGRVVEDADGMVHVALRRGGSLTKINPQTGTIVSVRSVCAAPRGVAYDQGTDNLHVACAGGQLVTLKARGGDVERTLHLDGDLRDVVVKGTRLLVSRFRHSELLEIDSAGTLAGRFKPRSVTGPDFTSGGMRTSSPTTAWRLVSLPGDETLMLHQRAVDTTVVTKSGGYGGGGTCGPSGIVTPGLTYYRGTDGSGTNVGEGTLPALTSLAIDAAVSPDGKEVTLISAGELPGVMGGQVAVYRRDSNQPPGTDLCQFPSLSYNPSLQGAAIDLTAAAYDSVGRLYVQARIPAELFIPATNERILFPGAEERRDEGHALFHSSTPAMIACASCHPEGGDDSHVWNFDIIGSRRTQNLRGGILATAPFHWDGDMNTLDTLMTQVFTGRMAGPPIASHQIASMGRWLDAQQKLPQAAPADPAAVSRGKSLFDSSQVGCASCHSGTHFTNNQTVDVGTGKALQVPTLIDLRSHAPYLHTGCAQTLRDRFDPSCGGGDRHGNTSQLAANQIDDLVAYLETL